MARRQVAEDPVNHERWIISYADFITLLFAFFVVMYSISQVNEGKYKVLSETLTDEFKTPQRTRDVLQVGELAKSNPLSLIGLDALGLKPEQPDRTDLAPLRIPEQFQKVAEQVEENFEQYVDKNLVNVRGNEEWLEIELQSSLLFTSGDAELSTAALELLASIADLFKNSENPVRVEGFTDNVPISTSRYPSNWELSAARASAVVQLFIEEGIAPSRLAAVGYGEHQPIADNSTAEGRAKNRRVVMMMSKTGRLRPVLNPFLERPEPAETEQQPIEIPAEEPVRVIGGLVTAPLTAAEQAERMAAQLLGLDEEGSTETEVSEEAEESQDEASFDGVIQRELDDGGLLFTAEPE